MIDEVFFLHNSYELVQISELPNIYVWHWIKDKNTMITWKLNDKPEYLNKSGYHGRTCFVSVSNQKSWKELSDYSWPQSFIIHKLWPMFAGAQTRPGSG